jgi:hypothetical protein
MVGVMGSFLVPVYPFSIFCGSFIGMTSPALLGYPQIMVASLVGGAIFAVGRQGFYGMGGKLGVTAFVGVWIVILLAQGSPAIPLIPPAVPELPMKILIVLISGIASFCTYFLNRRAKIHIVTSSGLVGLISVVLLSAAGSQHFHLLTAVVYCASFAGMCNQNRLRGPWLFVLVGLMSGLLFLVTIPIFHQYGGKLGTIAFIAALAAKPLVNGQRREPMNSSAMINGYG